MHAHDCFNVYADSDTSPLLPPEARGVSRWQQASASYQHTRERSSRVHYNTGRGELGLPGET